MKRRVPRVEAVFHKLFRCLVLDADLHDVLLAVVVFAEVGTQAALSVLNLKHDESPFALRARLLRVWRDARAST
jgi:hypothetical protein